MSKIGDEPLRMSRFFTTRSYLCLRSRQRGKRSKIGLPGMIIMLTGQTAHSTAWPSRVGDNSEDVPFVYRPMESLFRPDVLRMNSWRHELCHKKWE